MISRVKYRYAAALLCILVLFSLLQLSVSAVAVTGVSGVEVTVDSNGSISESSGTVTVTAKGSYSSYKKATVTITNTSGSTATISFSYTLKDYDAGRTTIDDLAGAASGNYSTVLQDKASLVVYLSDKSWSSRTATATLKNFKVEAAAAESDVTLTINNTAWGTVKVDGTEKGNNSTFPVSSSTGASFVATPASGGEFVGWVDTNGKIISTAKTYQLIPTEAMTIRAVFAHKDGDPIFKNKANDHLFETFAAAKAYVANTDKTIVLAANGTLSGSHEIPAGYTLLVPYDAGNTLCTTKPTVHENAYTKPTVYRTLYMASGASLTVKGILSVSGSQSSKYGGTNGSPSGPLGFINMKSGSTITVESGGALYAWGYVTGAGAVTVKSGGAAYECFQIADYRGGDATSSMGSSSNKTKGVFPFNQFYIQNVEVPMTLNSGSALIGYGSVYVTIAGVQKMDIPFIGADNSMFVLSRGSVTKDYLEGTGRTKLTLNGDLSITEVSISMKVSLIGNLDIDTANYVLPIPNHMTISVESGSNINLNQTVGFQPGSELYIREGATCTLGSGKKLYVYDLDQWLYNDGANGYAGTSNLPYVQLKYVPGGDGTTGRLKDALVEVNGTADLDAGSAYVTEGGANIYSTGAGKVIVKTTENATVNQVITNGTDIGSWPSIDVVPLVLKNADGSTVSATGSTASEGTVSEYPYYASTGRWDKPGHFYDEGVVTAPTCTENGYITYTCEVCGGTNKGDGDSVLGHTEVTDAAKAPTCTATGLTEGKHCSVCNEVLVAQEVVAALGHTAGAAADCTTAQTCTVCGAELAAALGHTEVIDAAVAPTCTATGLTEGKHCETCGETTVAQEEVAALGHSYGDWVVTTEPTCTVAGVETRTCTTCGGTETQPVNATGGPHKWEKVTDDEGKTITVCSACQTKLVFQVSMAVNDSLDLIFSIRQSDLAGLEDKLICNVTKQFADGRADVVQPFTFDSNTPVSEDGYYRLRFSDISAKEMMDNITAVISYTDDKTELISCSTSVQSYMHSLYDYYADSKNSIDPNDEANNAAKEKELFTALADLLNYGAACQTHFKYDTDHLANAAYGDLMTNATTASESESESAEAVNVVQTVGSYYYGTSFSAKNNLMFTFYYDFKGEINPEEVNVSALVVINNKEGTMYGDPLTIDSVTWYKRTSGTTTLYGIDITGIPLSRGDVVINCTLKMGDTTISTVSDSLASYASRAPEGTLRNTMQELLEFTKSANTYFS